MRILIQENYEYKGYEIVPPKSGGYGAIVYKGGEFVQAFDNEKEAEEYIDGLDSQKSSTILTKENSKSIDKFMDKYQQLEDVLGECFDPELLSVLAQEWKAFYNNPENYAGTAVVDMVNAWIDEQPVRW